MSDFNTAIKTILDHEGGWVDDLVDAGGETNFGWSMLTIKRLGLTKEELGIPNWDPGCLKHMTVDTAKALYKKHFWDKLGYEKIFSQVVATKTFDIAVNCGEVRAGMMVQKAVNFCKLTTPPLIVDGQLGPKSFAAINSVLTGDKLLDTICSVQTDYYVGIVIAKPSQIKFLRNWLRRAKWKGSDEHATW